MHETIIHVDAFTDQPFKGNPAAICLLEAPRDDDWMLALAKEMNLSETAFLLGSGAEYGLRWFTPATEVDLCGHATLASAHVLWEEGLVAAGETCRFETRSGLLKARRNGETIEMTFPKEKLTSTAAHDGLGEALGASFGYTGVNRLGYCLVELDAPGALETLTPDFRALASLPYDGVIATAASENEAFDFESRFFAPKMGIDEDPVTGSAHCVLGPYWERRLGKSQLRAYQASPRGGHVNVTVLEENVILGGQAVTIFKGTLR